MSDSLLSSPLASLEQRMEHREPMPLILDDVLVNFDDARAEQTLRIMEELSGKRRVWG